MDTQPLEPGEKPAAPAEPGPAVPWSMELPNPGPSPGVAKPIQLVPDVLSGKSVGGYVIEMPLGEGGMGVVYQARHPILNRRFAVKVLKPEAAANKWVAKSFLREAQTLSSLKHPHIVDIVDFGAIEGDQRQYMVMEFLEGKTLGHELMERGRLPCVRVLQLADQILDALAAAHSVDVIHRDLKPGNVLLAKVSGGSEVVKLVDFGLSKQTPSVLVVNDADATDKSALAGTPEYVAPEQARGQPACKQSDLYSFGVMLYEMLTGQLPFAYGADRKNRTIWLLNMHANAPAPRITPLPGGNPFPQELENLVAALLAKQPQDRPQTATLVRQEIQRILQSLTRTAMEELAPPTVQTPAVKRVDTISMELMVPPTRRLLPWALGALGVLVTLVGVVMTRDETKAATGPAPGQTTVTTRVNAPGSDTTVTTRVNAAPVVMAGAPVKPPEPADDALATLTPEPAPKPAEDEKPKKAALAIPLSPRPSLDDCEPSSRWRASAQARLQEIQQLAAGAGDGKMWAAFEKAEPVISEAIGKAASPQQCVDVELRIRTLARGMGNRGKR